MEPDLETGFVHRGQVMFSVLCNSQDQSSANPIFRQFCWCKGDHNLPHKEWIFFLHLKINIQIWYISWSKGDPHHLLFLTVLGKPAGLRFKSHNKYNIDFFPSLFLFLFRILFPFSFFLSFFFFFRWHPVKWVILAPFSQSLPTQNNSFSSLKICSYPQSVSRNAKTIYLTFTPANAYIRTGTYIWT